MSTAVRVGVDLNSRCSKKCAAPATVAPSSRDPTPTQTPTEAERTPGRYSVTTRNAAAGSAVCRPRRSGCVPELATGRCGIGRRGLGRRGFGRRGWCGHVAGCSGFFGHEHQRDLAALVDIRDLYPQLVADADDVLHPGDALAPAEFRDVHKAVTPRQQ